ncbi:hypothetical protein OQA88_3265 [Cercophora sp. LCS_1]
MSDTHNFCLPIRELANDRVKLTPFSNHHATPFIAQASSRPDLFSHMPMGPFSTPDAFITQFLEKVSRPNPAWFTFAIIDKTRPPSPEDDEGELAGSIAYLDTNATHLSTEIGAIVILPKFQRTHVTTNAVGLLLQYALDGVDQGSLGLRRVQWKANSMNEASIRTAKRLGFRMEGVLRWQMVFPGGDEGGKIGNGQELPRGSKKGDYGRDSVILGLCWDDWEGGLREEVGKAMARTV